jgi:hypothetical protein
LHPSSLPCVTPRTHLARRPGDECQTARLLTDMSIAEYCSQRARSLIATRTISTIFLLIRPSSCDIKKSSSYWFGIVRKGLN